MIKLYGIKNCDTIKKARDWLNNSHIKYQFHDYRIAGITDTQLRLWCNEFGWEQLINRRGLTWRKLPNEDKSDLNEEKAISLMQAHPAMIKRPILDTGELKILGFNPSEYEKILG